MNSQVCLSLIRAIITFTLFVLGLYSHGQSFLLRGTITNKDTGYVILRYFRDGINQNRSDTAFIHRGKFLFVGTVTGAEFAYLRTSAGHGISFFIEPDTINISFKDNEANKAIFSGSKVQEEYEAYLKYTSKENLALQRLAKTYHYVDSLLKDGSISRKTIDEERKEIDKNYTPVVKAKSNKELAYIRKHPDSFVSLLLLYTFVGRLSNDSIELIYNKLSQKVKGSTLDYRFLEYYTKVRNALSADYAFDKLRLTDYAPNFAIYNTQSNNNLSINDFKGKIVLLEFWGLYCLPCLRANPELEEIRKKYRSDELEIIAINNNLHNDVPQLISYITKNRLTEWIHVFTNNEVVQKDGLINKGDFSNYVGLAVPRTVLIDRDGKIIYKNYGYSDEEMERLKLLIEKSITEN